MTEKETNINLNALPLARNEYQQQLTTFLQPLITKGFWSIFRDSKKMCSKENKEQEVFKRFQSFVKKIPKWSSLTVDAETERIKQKINCLSELITIIFVGNVKILASIRLKGKHTNIKVKVPSCNNFIHTVYINTAKRIFYDPYLFDDNLDPIEKERNMNRIFEFIEKAISETISGMLPLDSILNEYLGNAFDSDVSQTDESSVSSSAESNTLEGEDIISEGEQVITQNQVQPSNVTPLLNLQNRKTNNFFGKERNEEKSENKSNGEESEEESIGGESGVGNESIESEGEESEGEESEGEESEGEESEEESIGGESGVGNESIESESTPPPTVGPEVKNVNNFTSYRKPHMDISKYKQSSMERKRPQFFNNFKPRVGESKYNGGFK